MKKTALLAILFVGFALPSSAQQAPATFTNRPITLAGFSWDNSNGPSASQAFTGRDPYFWPLQGDAIYVSSAFGMTNITIAGKPALYLALKKGMKCTVNATQNIRLSMRMYVTSLVC